jgi:hypothetical protein
VKATVMAQSKVEAAHLLLCFPASGTNIFPNFKCLCIHNEMTVKPYLNLIANSDD